MMCENLVLQVLNTVYHMCFNQDKGVQRSSNHLSSQNCPDGKLLVGGFFCTASQLSVCLRAIVLYQSARLLPS